MDHSAPDSIDAAGHKRPTLPVLPPGLPRLMSSLADDQIEPPLLAKVLEQYPSIAVRLVALANSAWVAPRDPVTSISAACSVLGLRVVRSVSLALAVARPFNATRCPAFDAKRFWATALLAAEGTALLAPQLADACDPHTLRTAGLLHHLGLLWMVDAWPAEAAAAVGAAEASAEPDLCAAQRAVCGTDYCELGGVLGAAWRLPAELTAAMRQHRAADYRGPHRQTAEVVGFAAALANAVWLNADVTTAEWHAPPGWLPSRTAQAAISQMLGERETILALAQSLF